MLNVVPVVGQTLGNSRDLIAANFATINTAFSVNHVQYNDGSGNQGKHNFVEFPTATPTKVTTAGEVALYSKNGVGAGTVPELYFQRQSLGADAGYSITQYGQGTVSSGGVNYAYQWTRLPSGLLQLWGRQTNTGPAIPGGGLQINFPLADLAGSGWPAFGTSCFNVQLSEFWSVSGFGLDRPIALVPGSITQLKFNITISSNGVGPGSYANNGAVSFTAIGI